MVGDVRDVEDFYDGAAGMGSWLSSAAHAIEHGVSRAAEAVGNVAKSEGHIIGNALANPYVKGALAAGLAATGVGIPLAAGIMAGEGIVGGALQEHGGIKAAIVGGAEGAAAGAVASGLVKVAPSVWDTIKTAVPKLADSVSGASGTPTIPAPGGVPIPDFDGLSPSSELYATEATATPTTGETSSVMPWMLAAALVFAIAGRR